MLLSIINTTKIGEGYLYHLEGEDKDEFTYFSPRKYYEGQVLTTDVLLTETTGLILNYLSPTKTPFTYTEVLDLTLTNMGNDCIKSISGTFPRPKDFPIRFIPETQQRLKKYIFARIKLEIYGRRWRKDGFWRYYGPLKVKVLEIIDKEPFIKEFGVSL